MRLLKANRLSRLISFKPLNTLLGPWRLLLCKSATAESDMDVSGKSDTRPMHHAGSLSPFFRPDSCQPFLLPSWKATLAHIHTLTHTHTHTPLLSLACVLLFIFSLAHSLARSTLSTYIDSLLPLFTLIHPSASAHTQPTSPEQQC